MPAPTPDGTPSYNHAVVDVQPEPVNEEKIRGEQLVSWIVERVDAWEQYRDNNYEALWKEYYRAWKAVWTESEKTRATERSRFISPALQQSIEMAVSEAEEATFGRVKWIDIEDDLRDENKTDQTLIRDQLLEDMELNQVPDAISECYLNGAIYGTAIGKIIVSEKEELVTGENGVTRPMMYTCCELEAVSPEDFVIEPEARTIEEASGCAHIVVRPIHLIEQKQAEGVYKAVPLGEYADDRDVTSKGEWKSNEVGDKCEIIEYHGLVPTWLLLPPEDDDSDDDPFKMVEAIVTIANRGALLKAVENPFTHKDRSIVAFQWDKVPNRFWGRGVAEKGINSQRALNAELRARQDGLALTIHPMMAADANRLPRGMKLEVAPGKQILTNGNPRDVLNPMHFGEMSSHTYQQAGELERMLQMATGSMDSASPLSSNRRNETMGGMSMIQSGAIKRSKRTMQVIERRFLSPMIKKMVYRYMQFDPMRYPSQDYRFLPRSGMGILAREFTMSQIAQAMQVVPPDSPAFGILLNNFFANSALPDKEEVAAQIAQMYEQKGPDPAQQLELQKLIKEIEKMDSEIVENYAQAEAKQRQTEVNAFNAVAQVEDNELDRNAFGQKGRN